MPLVVVLVEPAGPLNVGSAARLCANFGISELRLVAPRCDHLGDEARRMAVHAQPLLERALVFPGLADAIADCRRVVAASGRPEAAPVAVVDPPEAFAWLAAGGGDGEGAAGMGRALGDGPDHSPGPAAAPAVAVPGVAVPGAAALVFGREDRGLSNDELLQAGRVLRIAADPAYTSLNLSHALAIVLHEWHRFHARSPGPGPGPTTALPTPVRRADLEAALADAQALLLEVGFLLPHTAHARMVKVRGLLQRAQIDADEVALVRGMVRQLRWATDRRTP
ncbi:RNA methyltransferase [Synechococcus sp. ATX 2A4]|nr:RNA methyltransferase [Synechococcus sp. ATX 2A4]MCP9884431.1 RNA methyltransferase [Synechococcus sp. ATX 2A4]